MSPELYPVMLYTVAPHWGAWIEIRWTCWCATRRRVAPHWGAWIEIALGYKLDQATLSHPTGVRGLK